MLETRLICCSRKLPSFRFLYRPNFNFQCTVVQLTARYPAAWLPFYGGWMIDAGQKCDITFQKTFLIQVRHHWKTSSHLLSKPTTTKYKTALHLLTYSRNVIHFPSKLLHYWKTNQNWILKNSKSPYTYGARCTKLIDIYDSQRRLPRVINTSQMRKYS